MAERVNSENQNNNYEINKMQNCALPLATLLALSMLAEIFAFSIFIWRLKFINSNEIKK